MSLRRGGDGPLRAPGVGLMRMAFRWSLWFTFLASLALLVFSLRGRGSSDGPPLRFVPNPLIVPGALQSGEEYDLEVEVVNESGEPARLIGSLDYCGGACLSSQGLPIEIPAGGSRRTSVHVAARVPGSLSEALTYYTDRPSQPTLTIRLEGLVAEASPHEPTTTQAANP